jgi:beta-N-acetylhexosaminidase
MKNVSAAIYGWRKPALDKDARAFFKDARPWGLILFQGACENRAQVSALIDDFHEATGRKTLVFIDQEGGRVARLKPPEWPVFPSAAVYARLYARQPSMGVEAVRLGHHLIAHELQTMGVRADCAPVLDIPQPDADPIIGDRAFGLEPDSVAILGKAALDGLADGGVAGVIKHIPGHGRADADSHLALPRANARRATLESTDYKPFMALNAAPMAMTAHVLYPSLDPDRCATLSPIVIEDVIRTKIGFDGLLMTDDLDMKALGGTMAMKVEDSLKAGCDVVLQCSGELKDMLAVADVAPKLSGQRLRRAELADKAGRRMPKELDVEAGWARLRELLAHGQEAVA